MIKKITRRNLERFLKKHATKERMLDIGSGGSSYGRFFPNRYSVDIDPKRNPDLVGDAHHLPFGDEEFPVILCTEMLEHVDDPKQVVSELMRVLMKGGKLILTTRFVYPIHDSPNDYWRFSKYGLRKLFAQWNILEEEDETRSFSALGALIQRLCYQGKLRGGVITKSLLFFIAFLFDHLNWLIVEEYGDIRKSSPEQHILTTGIYIVVSK